MTESIESGATFLGELNKCVPVLAAFWLKETEEKPWYLYVVPEHHDPEDPYAAYGEVARITNEMRDPDLDAFRVKIIPPSHSGARAAMDYLQLYPGRKPIRRRGTNLGGLVAEEVYIYPKPVPVS